MTGKKSFYLQFEEGILARTGETDDIDKLRRAKEITDRLQQAGFQAYFVGGCVRDFVRGVTPGDYDIVTSALPEQVAKLFAHTVAVGAKFGVVVVIVNGYSYEVATFRRDHLYEDGRHPAGISFSSARDDALRRDFTVNGLLMDTATAEIIDYVGGKSDIEKKIIRTIGDPDSRFREDYLRMMRAIRFAANLGFTIDDATLRAIEANASRIKEISAERLQEELGKILIRGGAHRGLELMAQTGILKEILPEVDKMRGIAQPPRFHPEGDVWRHTVLMLEILSVQKNPAVDLSLAWGVLLHDIGKPVTRTEDEKGVHFYGHVQQGEKIADMIMQRLRFSRAQRETVLTLIHYHMVFMNVQKMRPARLKRFLRMPDFKLHLELHHLDCLASHGLLDNYDFCLHQLHSLEKEGLHPRLFTGDDLIALGFTPGKVIGEILHALEDEQLEGRIASREEAAAYALANWKDRTKHSK
jgi:poly(A) polymerase